MPKTFDVIIPTYNNCSELKSCLSGFEGQTFDDFNVFLCVDGSTDDTLKYLQNYHPGYSLVILEHPDKKNHGRNPTRNLALNQLKSKYVVFLDSDLVPEKGFLKNHFELLEMKNCVSVGDVIYNNTKSNIWAYYQSTRGKKQYSDGDILPFRYLGIQNAAMSSEVFKFIGGFDDRMTTYGGNDNELSYRINQYPGIQFVYNEKACVSGNMNKNLDQALLQLYEFGENNLHYLLGKYPDYGDLFQAETLLSKNIFAKLVFNKGWVYLIKMIFPFSLKKTTVIMIHFLTAFYIRSGFMKNKIIEPVFDQQKSKG